MVKKCRVLLNNDLVTVIDFNGKKVQLPSIKANKEEINILFDSGRFSVVPDDYVEVRTKKKHSKKQQ